MIRREQIVNTLLLVVCILLYISTRIFRATYSGESFLFLKYHFTDFVAPVFVLSYSGVLLNIKHLHSVKNLLQVLFLCTLCSFVWEYCAQFFRPRSTPDWIDVCSVYCGGFLYWGLINLLSKES